MRQGPKFSRDFQVLWLSLGSDDRVESMHWCCRSASITSLLMTTKKMRLKELSRILGRMRELVRLLKADPEPEQFVVLLCELSGLFNEAEGRLRQLGG